MRNWPKKKNYVVVEKQEKKDKDLQIKMYRKWQPC